jgi:hypothetical protein
MSRRERVVVFQWDIDAAMQGAAAKIRELFPDVGYLTTEEEKPATHRSSDGWVSMGTIHGTLPSGSAISYVVQWNGWTGERRLTRATR